MNFGNEDETATYWILEGVLYRGLNRLDNPGVIFLSVATNYTVDPPIKLDCFYVNHRGQNRLIVKYGDDVKFLDIPVVQSVKHLSIRRHVSNTEISNGLIWLVFTDENNVVYHSILSAHDFVVTHNSISLEFVSLEIINLDLIEEVENYRSKCIVDVKVANSSYRYELLPNGKAGTINRLNPEKLWFEAAESYPSNTKMFTRGEISFYLTFENVLVLRYRSLKDKTKHKDMLFLEGVQSFSSCDSYQSLTNGLTMNMLVEIDGMVKILKIKLKNSTLDFSYELSEEGVEVGDFSFNENMKTDNIAPSKNTKKAI